MSQPSGDIHVTASLDRSQTSNDMDMERRMAWSTRVIVTALLMGMLAVAGVSLLETYPSSSLAILPHCGRCS